MKIIIMIKAGLHIVKLILNLGFIWLTLGWKVRRARKAFERELINGGISKEDARRLGKKYASVKDEVMRGIKNSIWRMRR